jgi:hypothetical protein
VTPAMLGLHQPTGKTLLHERIRGRAGGICSKDAGPRGKALYKVACAQTEGQRTTGPCQDHGHRGASSRAARHLTCNQAPAYIRGPGPLD